MNTDKDKEKDPSYWFEEVVEPDLKPKRYPGICALCGDETLVEERNIGLVCFGQVCRIMSRNVKRVLCPICKQSFQFTQQNEHAERCMLWQEKRSARQF